MDDILAARASLAEMLRELALFVREGIVTELTVELKEGHSEISQNEFGSSGMHVPNEAVIRFKYVGVLSRSIQEAARSSRPSGLVTMRTDPSLPPGTAEFRDADGRLLGRIINIGDG